MILRVSVQIMLFYCQDFSAKCGKRCEVTVETRSYCKKCRLQKCFDSGMKINLILSEFSPLLNSTATVTLFNNSRPFRLCLFVIPSRKLLCGSAIFCDNFALFLMTSLVLPQCKLQTHNSSDTFFIHQNVAHQMY